MITELLLAGAGKALRSEGTEGVPSSSGPPELMSTWGSPSSRDDSVLVSVYLTCSAELEEGKLIILGVDCTPQMACVPLPCARMWPEGGPGLSPSLSWLVLLRGGDLLSDPLVGAEIQGLGTPTACPSGDSATPSL